MFPAIMLTMLHNARMNILEAKDVRAVSDLCGQCFREVLTYGLAGPKEPYRVILQARTHAKMLAAYFYGGIHGALQVALSDGAFTIERCNVVNVALLRDETALMPLGTGGVWGCFWGGIGRSGDSLRASFESSALPTELSRRVRRSQTLNSSFRTTINDTGPFGDGVLRELSVLRIWFIC
jgi:hypothetical protein